MSRTLFLSEENFNALISSLVISALLFSSIVFVVQAYAATGAATLSVTVNNSLTFSIDTPSFSNITPGTAQFASTTLNVSTNDANGYIVSLSGDNKSGTNNNLQRTGDTTVQITDQTEWVPGTATTSAGNAVRISSLANAGNVLAFRVMSASSTNGTSFLSTTWWGSSDLYVDSANTLWAGIASSTIQRTIGNAGVGSYSASAHLNTVLYYLNVGTTQKTGAYTAPITYTATAN